MPSFASAVFYLEGGCRGGIQGTRDFRVISGVYAFCVFEEKGARVATVGLFLLPEQLTEYMRQARELRASAKYFGTDLFETVASNSPVPGLFENCVYPDNSASEEFRVRYRNEWGTEAHLTFAGSAYEMALVIADAIRHSSTHDPDEWRSYLRHSTDRQGVLGKFNFVSDTGSGQYFAYPVVIKEIKGGKGVRVDERRS